MKKIILLLLAIFFTYLLNAQTWDGSASTDWNTPANWSTNAVPISTGAVIIPVPGVITNWPVLANNVTIGRITLNSGSQLNTAGFNFTLTTIAGGGINITGATITNPVPANTSDFIIPGGSPTINGSTFNGNFSFSKTSTGQFDEANTAANTWNGDVTFTLGSTGGLVLSEVFASAYNGNVTVIRLSGVISTTMFRAGGVVITGNFSYTNPIGGALNIGHPSAGDTRILGTLNINAQNSGGVSIQRVKNETNGGSILLDWTSASTILQDSLVVISMTMNGITGISLTSNYISGPLSITQNGNGGSFFLNNNIFGNDATFTKTGTGQIDDAPSTPNIYMGNATFNAPGTAGIVLSSFDTSSFHKNVTVNGGGTLTIRGLRFVGNTNSEFTQLGTQPVSMARLIMEKTGGARLTLNDPVEISTSVRFTSGNIYTTTANYLRFNHSINYTGGNDSSHVVGPVQKLGTVSASPFAFPVGGDTTLNLVTMSNHGSATAIFSAQFFKANPSLAGYDTSQHAGTIQRISGCEYWDVQRLNGTSTPTLTFSFEAPCAGSPVYISNPAFVRIARWTGATWEDLGNGGSTGTTTGTVTTGAPVTNFSPFTFGSTNILINPLPVSLLSFTASKDNGKTKLTWKTTDEINISHFVIERSTDGANYSSMASAAAANTPGAHEYSLYDVFPAKGINYYRLRMVDIDDKFKLSHIARVDFKKNITVTISPNPATGEIIIQSDKKVTGITLIDMNGRTVKQFSPSANNRYDISAIRAGMYMVSVSADEFTETIKLLKQ